MGLEWLGCLVIGRKFKDLRVEGGQALCSGEVGMGAGVEVGLPRGRIFWRNNRSEL